MLQPLGPQCLSSQFDLETQLRWRPRNNHRLRLWDLCETVMLLFVFLVFLVFALVNIVQTGAAFTCGEEQVKKTRLQ